MEIYIIIALILFLLCILLISSIYYTFGKRKSFLYIKKNDIDIIDALNSGLICKLLLSNSASKYDCKKSIKEYNESLEMNSFVKSALEREEGTYHG